MASCKITTRWCNQVTNCKAELVADGDSFIDPPVSSLSPAQGSALNPAPPPGSPITTVEYIFENGKWKYWYWTGSSYFYGGNQSAERIQPTKLKETCQQSSVCYEAEGECPGGSPPGTPPPDLYDNYTSWQTQAENAANGYGTSPTSTLPTLPIDLGVDQEVSEKNDTGGGPSIPGSTTPTGYTTSGDKADCVSFDNPTIVSNNPIGGPTTNETDGPALTATN